MTTDTFAVLRVSRAAYDEIAEKLHGAGYITSMRRLGGGASEEVVDMHGIALAVESEEVPSP